MCEHQSLLKAPARPGAFFLHRASIGFAEEWEQEGASIIMAPRKFSGPIQRGAIRVLRDMEVASTSDIMPIISRFANVLCCRFHLLIFTLRFIPAPSASDGKGQEDQGDDRIAGPHFPSQGIVFN